MVFSEGGIETTIEQLDKIEKLLKIISTRFQSPLFRIERRFETYMQKAC